MTVPVERVDLMGVELDHVDESQAIGAIVAAMDAGRGGSVITVNVDILRQLVRDERLGALLSKAELVVADGMPLVWASRIKGSPLPARVAGSDLIWSLTAETALSGRRVFLLGGAPGSCEAAERKLRACYPGLDIAGCHSPRFGFESDPAEVARLRRRVRDAAPDLVYVALGFPKQERAIEQLREDLPRAWFVGVGISFSFLGDRIARAPDSLSRVGLEWLHRLAQEPRRLAKRYLLHGIPFAGRLLAHAAACRLLRRELAPPRATRPVPLEIAPARVVFGRGLDERQRAEELGELGALDLLEPEPVE